MLSFHVKELKDHSKVQVTVHEDHLQVARVVCGPSFEEAAAALATAAGLRQAFKEGLANG